MGSDAPGLAADLPVGLPPGLPVGRLDGRVALITGAGSGLGRATALLLARRGAQVVCLDLVADAAAETVALLGEPGPPDPPGGGPPARRHLALSGDVSDQASVDAVIAAVLGECGRIDVLVNSAGIAEGKAATLDQDLAHWQRIIDVNLTGSYLMCQAVARSMRGTGGGVILNMSSIAGVIGLPRRTAYSASKGAVSMMTKVLAAEWAPYGIRVNAVAPGYIRTAMTERLMAEGRLDLDAIIRRSPTGAMGTAADVAEALAFLASDQARFITGVVLPVDGAYTVYGAPEDAYPGVLGDEDA